jgi:predicted transcriptional regulator
LSSNGGNKKGKMVDWRRNKVQQLLVRGYSQWDVAEELQIDQSTVSRDIQYLRQQAQANLQKHIQQKLPEEYQRCLTGMNQVLKLSWQIANNNTSKQNGQDHNDNINTKTTGDDRTRLQALSLINDCYRYIMDLTTNGVVITDAIKFVQTNKERITMSTKEENKESREPDYDEDEDQLEEKQEEETGTTNHVFDIVSSLLTVINNLSYLEMHSLLIIMPFAYR